MNQDLIHPAVRGGSAGDPRLITPPPRSGGPLPPLDHGRLLVVRVDRLGDLILSLPVLGTLRTRFPAAELTLLTSPALAPLLTAHPWIDQLLVDDRRGDHGGLGGWWRLVGEIRAGSFDLALVLRPTPRHASLPWAAGVRLRVGTAFRAYSWLFNRRVRLHRRRTGQHELELNLAMLAAAIGPLPPLAPLLTVPRAAVTEARSLLEPIGAGETLMVLHPGSGGSAREWPAAHYAELAGRLRARGYRIVLTGSEAEVPLVTSIAAAAGPVLNLAGLTSLPVMAAVLAEAAAVVACSTGPLHLAAALGRPVVALFPPLLDASPRRWGPWSSRAAVLEARGPACSRCTREQCSAWDCMASITPAEVMSAIMDLLAVPDQPAVPADAGPGPADRAR